MPHYTALVTLLVIALYFFFATRVAVAHRKFGVKLPAMTGNLDFERIARVHANTLEWIPTFLVPLWLCAITFSDVAAAALGIVWIIGRVMYFAGYRQAVEKRLPGFFVQSPRMHSAVCRSARRRRHAIGARLKPHRGAIGFRSSHRKARPFDRAFLTPATTCQNVQSAHTRRTCVANLDTTSYLQNTNCRNRSGDVRMRTSGSPDCAMADSVSHRLESLSNLPRLSRPRVSPGPHR